MKVWQVWDGDYDSDWVVATYDSEALAREHAKTYGLHRVEPVVVETELPPDAIDPALRAERAEQRRVEEAHARVQYQEQREREQREAKQLQTLTIDQVRCPSLCNCRTFSSHTRFISPHGYCRYCGGWTPEVFRAFKGEAALVDAIAELNIHERRKMLELCGLPVSP